MSQHLWTKLGQEGHPVESQFGAWDQEAKKGFYVRPELPETRGSLAHCGSEPTWIYLPEEPDYSKHRPEPEDFGEEAGDSETESDDAPVEVREEAAPVEAKEAEAARVEDEQETVMQQKPSELLQLQTAAARRRKGQRAAAAEAARAEAEEKVEEVESSVSDEAWGHWKPAKKKDRLKGTPARVEPEGDLHQHRYGKVPARAKKSQGTPPIPEESPPPPRRAKKSRDTSPPEESPPSPRRAKKSRDTSPPEESPRSKPRVERQIYLPPHKRELSAKVRAEPKDAPSGVRIDTKRTRPAEPVGPPPKASTRGRSPLPRRSSEPEAQKERRVVAKTPPKAPGAKYVPPHKRQKKEESVPVPEPKAPPSEPEPKASQKYVPPHRRAKSGGSAPSSARAPAYSVSKASRDAEC